MQAQDQERLQQHLPGGQLLAEEQSIHSLRTKECPKQGQVLPADEKKQDRQQYDKSTKTNSPCNWKNLYDALCFTWTITDIKEKANVSKRKRNFNIISSRVNFS